MKRGADASVDIEAGRAVKKQRVEVESVFLTHLPSEMWIEIAQHLDEQSLVALQLTCSELNQCIGAINSLWQPLLNRLHAMDSSISDVAPAGQSVGTAFNQAFAQLQQRCKDEVFSLCENHDIGDDYPLIQTIDLQEGLSLAQLEALNIELDAFNASLIRPKIHEAIRHHSTGLNISWMKLTRLPGLLFAEPEYQPFWQTLTWLDCSGNQLRFLPASIGELQTLQGLVCSYNQLRFLPESIDRLQTLQTLVCSNNPLRALPESIGGLQALQFLDCYHNQLRALPESIGELQELEILDCPHNHLHALPESIGRLQALRILNCSHNQLHALPDSICELPALQWLFCKENHLHALPEGLKARFGGSWARDMLASQRQTPTALTHLFSQLQASSGARAQEQSTVEAQRRLGLCSIL